MAIILTLAAPDAPHVSRQAGDPVAGVPIPEILHGQMPVIADHGSDILALAERQAAPSQDFTRVLNYAKIQRAWCLWGLVPGSISDETSPFNACSHAYLAALRQLLLRMTADPGNAAAAALALRVDRDMMQSPTALELCDYSAMPYDTATMVRPVWANVAAHPASAASLGGLAFLLAFATVQFARWSGIAAVV